jgi:hypothetical protein
MEFSVEASRAFHVGMCTERAPVEAGRRMQLLAAETPA